MALPSNRGEARAFHCLGKRWLRSRGRGSETDELRTSGSLVRSTGTGVGGLRDRKNERPSTSLQRSADVRCDLSRRREMPRLSVKNVSLAGSQSECCPITCSACPLSPAVASGADIGASGSPFGFTFRKCAGDVRRAARTNLTAVGVHGSWDAGYVHHAVAADRFILVMRSSAQRWEDVRGG